MPFKGEASDSDILANIQALLEVNMVSLMAKVVIYAKQVCPVKSTLPANPTY